MKIRYELNPPKILREDSFDLVLLGEDLHKFVERARSVIHLVDAIHITDSVLGIPRVSSITAVRHLKKLQDSLDISCSLRTRDRNYISICQYVVDAVLVGAESILVLTGDEPNGTSNNSALKPTEIVKMLRKEKYNEKINLNLAVPGRIKTNISSSSSIQKKIDAKPDAIVTQSIASLHSLGEIVDIAKKNNIKVVACIMVPSEKNQPSADMIGLNWTEYKSNPVDFIREAGKMADEILLTSPNNFRAAIDLLRQFK
jgi:5,10-methylenetetrahydrofolate reductase